MPSQVFQQMLLTQLNPISSQFLCVLQQHMTTECTLHPENSQPDFVKLSLLLSLDLSISATVLTSRPLDSSCFLPSPQGTGVTGMRSHAWLLHQHMGSELCSLDLCSEHFTHSFLSGPTNCCLYSTRTTLGHASLAEGRGVVQPFIRGLKEIMSNGFPKFYRFFFFYSC